MSSRSNYYEFREAKVAIAMELMKRDWKVYGFKEDESDSMTDYWSPASWSGIATKNGFVVVVDCDSNYYSGRKIYTSSASNEEIVLSAKIQATIKKLKEVRQDRGASAAEEETAKKKIEALLQKSNKNKKSAVEVTDYYPEFQPNPPRMSWHVEKDGVIIAKGNGVAKFAAMEYFDKKDAESDLKYYDKNSYRYERAEELLKIHKSFMTLINKIDSAAGSMIGGSDGAYVYENVEVTEYKREKKAVECAAGSLKEGQCFIVKSPYFNHGICKGYVYVIHEHDGYYTANRLNKKLEKELTGNANKANSFGCITGSYADKFLKWFKNNSLAWCEIVEQETPYKVQKCLKKKIG